MNKMKLRQVKGFTLVELLIVIALISILSVAVLATINPIEQSNKAKDASLQNDAAEVMNAYERFYSVKSTYPWMDVDASATIKTADTAWFGRSDEIGAGLCTTAANIAGGVTEAPSVKCDTSTTRGWLISTDELKDSFLTKPYTAISASDPGFSAFGLNYLWIDKKGTKAGNSIYVCYIPKAKSNKTATTLLYKPMVTNGVVTGLIKATGIEISAATWTDVATSLMKCVP